MPGQSSPSPPPCEPFLGFAATAGAVVAQLNRQLPGMALWLVTSVDGDRQLVVASAGEWAERAPAGTEFSWESSLCIRMVSGQAPALAVDIGAESSYQQACIGPLAGVRAYLGVPLQLEDGTLFGTLCAFAGAPRPSSWHEALPTVSLMGRLLSTVLTGQRSARDRSIEAAWAYALVDRDPLTSLSNRRGFEHAVRTEQGRAQRFGTRSSVIAITLDRGTRGAGSQPDQQPDHQPDHQPDQESRRCAAVLTSFCAPGDVAARTGVGEFALLAVETDLIGARALQVRMRRSLREVDLSASTGVATRRQGEDLTGTWTRAQRAAMLDELRRGLRARPTRIGAGR